MVNSPVGRLGPSVPVHVTEAFSDDNGCAPTPPMSRVASLVTAIQQKSETAALMSVQVNDNF